MSRDAVAAVLARGGLACGDRLAALSLASFAGRGHRAWPGATAAAQRAGLSRSRYLQARDRLVRRGLVVGRARAPELDRHGDGWEAVRGGVDGAAGGRCTCRGLSRFWPGDLVPPLVSTIDINRPQDEVFP